MKKYSLGSLYVVVSFCSNNEARVYLKVKRYFKKTLRDTNFEFIFTYRKSTTGICHTTNNNNSSTEFENIQYEESIQMQFFENLYNNFI